MTETQTILPFPEWQISPLWGKLLAIVNSWARWENRYGGIQDHLYGLKDRILTRHAVPDGTDLQIITLHCNACAGRGFFGWAHRDICRKCVGSGEYARDYITLGRYRIGEHVFHIPVPHSRFRVFDGDPQHWRPTGEGHRGVIHQRLSPEYRITWYRLRWLALLALTLRFDPRQTGEALRIMWRSAKRSLRAWWSFGGGAEWRVRTSLALAGLPINWGEVNEDESVPF